MRKGILLPAIAAVWGFTAAATPGLAEPADICGTLSSAQPGTSLPAITANESVRVLAFGDYGDGSTKQMTVAKAMAAYGAKHPFDFGLTLGDNFYGRGLNSPTHSRWRRDWEIPYGPLGIRIYAILGNHDYLDSASPPAEIQRSKLSKSWCLPTHYYTFTAGPVQFFALDTDPIHRGRASSKVQLDWLKAALAASQAPWKVVYGHHPAYSTGSEHGNETQPIRSALLPLLSDRVEIFLAGHDHNMEYLKPEKGVHFFVSGAGGHELRPMGPDPQNRRLWAVGGTLGFTVLEANKDALSILFLCVRDLRNTDPRCKGTDQNPVELCRVTIRKDGKVDDSACKPQH